jgi:BioD-like phosphotransacetylase family protein
MGTPRSASVAELTQPTLRLEDAHAGAAIGLVLTGGYRPRKAVIEAIRRADLFATIVPDDTYTVASAVHDLLVKTHAADHEKIELIKELVATNLDIDRVLGVATEAQART